MALALLLLWRNKLFDARWMHWILFLATPFPFIANIAGWFTTELGRQPWIIYGLLHTAQGSSTNVSSGNVLFTLLGFAGMYLLLGLPYVTLIIYETGKGPAVLAAGAGKGGPQSQAQKSKQAEGLATGVSPAPTTAGTSTDEQRNGEETK